MGDTITRLVPYKLSKDETDEFARMMAEEFAHLNELKNEKKRIAAKFALDEKAITAECERLTQIVRTGREMRLVVCYEEVDFKASIVWIVRSDTAERVGSRAITERDRQGQLKLG